jgi:uncharacterized membrane protein
MMHVMAVMMPIVVMVMMMVVVVVMFRRSHGSRTRRRSGFLRDGVAGQAERERGGGDKGLDH